MSSYQKGYRKTKKKYDYEKYRRYIAKQGYGLMKYVRNNPTTSMAAVWSAIASIKSMINCEVHKYDVSTNSQTVPYVSAPSYSSFVNIAQGDTEETRTGNSILLKYISIQGLVRNAATTPAPAVRLRLMVLEDTQEVVDNVGTYTLGQILEYATSGTAITSPISSDYVGRFKILLNKVFSLDTINHPQQSFKAYIPMSRKHVRYNGTTANDIQKRNVFWFIISDNDPSTGSMYSNPTYNIQYRTAFYDN